MLVLSGEGRYQEKNKEIQILKKGDVMKIAPDIKHWHGASASGIITTFLGSSVVVLRRSGSTAALDQLNKYFSITEMPIRSGLYWNMVHGRNADEVKEDIEGIQNMHILAKNMA